MKKLISMAMVALLLGAGTAGAEMPGGGGMQDKPAMGTAQQQRGGPGAQPGPPGPPAKTETNDMAMMDMGQAMMPAMVNMMLSDASAPSGMGGKMMNMPMMGASMMPMGMGGMGMMPLMIGGSSDETAERLEKYRGFLKETKSKRKELHDLALVYFEARWTPETTVQQLQDIALKMRKLRDEIMAKMPQ